MTVLPPLVVMGVSGCGKSTVGLLLGERLAVDFFDGNDFHPAANKAKMAGGVPLNDDDRAPWLAENGAALANPPAGGGLLHHRVLCAQAQLPRPAAEPRPGCRVHPPRRGRRHHLESAEQQETPVHARKLAGLQAGYV